MSNLKTLTYNERRIVESLRASGKQTRAELARMLNLTPPTITRLTNNLLQLNLLMEKPDESDKVKLGYPSKLLDIQPSGLFTAGVFFNPDFIYTCICDLAGNMIVEQRIEIDDRSFDHIMSLAGKSIALLVKKSKVNKSKILGVGVSYPGHFTPNSNQVFKIKQFANWPDVNVNVDFSSYFDFPVVHMGDSNAAMLAELYYGACRSFNSCCLVLFSYGIGGASIINHRLYVGSNKNSAEFGGLFPKSKPRPSGQDLIDSLRREGHTIGRLSDVGEQHFELPVMQDWIDRSTEHVKWLCLIIARTFDPEAIVFAGTIPTTIIDHFVNKIGSDKSLGEDFNVNGPHIVRATTDKYPQLGAAALPIYSYFNPDNFSGRTTKGR